MVQFFQILFGTYIGLIYFNKYQTLIKDNKKLGEERDYLNKRIDYAQRKYVKYHQVAKRAVKYQFRNELWQIDTEGLIRELLKRTDDNGKPIIYPHTIRDEKGKNILVGMLSTKKIDLREL